MAIKLTDSEKQAPSERLAKNLKENAAYEGERSKLDEQQATCLGFSMSLAGFCIENALTEATNALARLDNRPELAGVRASLQSIQYWMNSGMAESKDAIFILDGYHDWHKQNVAWEEEASEDLDICGCAGKWKSAKDGVTRDKPGLDGSAYWDAVRTYFLELGGCYLSERCEPAPIDWEAPLPRPIIPVVGDWSEPRKVRQA